MRPDVSASTSARIIVRVAATLSLLAAAVHAAVVEDHLAEWWGYGAFFIAASLAQGLYGLVLFALPARPAWPASDWLAWRRRLYLAGIAGNLAVIALYAVTRTVGIPLLGPEAGTVEAVGALDAASKAFEAGLVACLLVLLRG